ncbi:MULTISPECIES: hypothetical protein [Burkholderia]|uniref:Uncharacterized protein n=1 Tax=Burkholderia cenocepacia TaxID=95486 RepID=A0ABD4UI75_9BURK|nr:MULTISPECIES: hypothetical protein [Burkholderia]ELW9529415.1 hypothetical protein [Burkholderia cenocepacia]MBJ9692242.1 hypothetical protein [Burkholderia cenocepacia]MBN3532625.1 hypothetical protein [Burkholderia cenocepacia]MBR7936284.1 hypothetical protein [Burkholderia cenocepacia]MBR8116809.1 hypothetical protein [Burkholderia cenocepacia]
MTETSIVERIVQCCENAGKSNPSPFNQQRKNANDGLFEKTAADYVKVIMVYCPLWISGCRLTCRFKMAGRVLY